MVMILELGVGEIEWWGLTCVIVRGETISKCGLEETQGSVIREMLDLSFDSIPAVLEVAGTSSCGWVFALRSLSAAGCAALQTNPLIPPIME
jgi:hypothetical protein